HVDAHRSVALIISPYTQRGVVDSTMYTTTGILRTMELILGLEPLSQYDAAAIPAFHAFQNEPVLTAYQHVEPQTSIDEKNSAEAYGASESLAMDWSHPDRIPMGELNRILWRSSKGSESVVPPPVRAAFLRDVKESEDD